jgi:trehalose/maltose hydrolase-like predicted phosphorylase
MIQDEFAYNINNGAYTNAGIKMLLGIWAQEAAKTLGITPPNNWTSIADHIKIPYNEKEDIIIEYDGMDGLVQVKQASVALINYPLGWNINEMQARNDVEFVREKLNPECPWYTELMPSSMRPQRPPMDLQ